MWEYQSIETAYNDGELMHYGVPGMQWGKRKKRLISKNIKLAKRADKKAVRAVNLERRAEKVHILKDVKGGYRMHRQATKNRTAAERARTKASRTTDATEKANLELKATKYDYRQSNAVTRYSKYSKTTPYGRRALKLSSKSNNARLAADKARYQIAKNEKIMRKLDGKIEKAERDAAIEAGKKLLQIDSTENKKG